MLTYPHIDPVALQLGPVAVHWYGLTYLLAFGLFMLLGVFLGWAANRAAMGMHEGVETAKKISSERASIRTTLPPLGPIP